MDPDTPGAGTNYNASALGPAKRKRGRRLNGSHPNSMGSVSTANDITIGQVVSGFIESSFDDGYMLYVRAGNSETTMRGVVFKHGRFVPVSAENDVAPDVKMIDRCEITQQGENLSNLQTSGGFSRDENGVAYHSLSFSPSNLVSSGGKLPLSMSTQVTGPTPSRGNVVPVILQPVTSVNGSIVSNQPHPVAMQDACLSSVDGYAPPVPILGSHTLNGSAVIKASETQESVSAEGAQNQLVGEGSQSGAPFENLVTEVIKRIQHPTQVDGNLNESSKSVGKSTSRRDDEVSDTDDQPLFIEPLQTLQPVLTSNPSLTHPQLDNNRTAKMTELLQENVAGNILSQNQNPAAPGATR